jgi:leucyl aminopeptidase
VPIDFRAVEDIPDDVDAVGVGVFAGLEPMPDSPVEMDLAFLAANGFEGKPGQAQALLGDDGTTVIALGLGPAAGAGREPEAEILRKAGAAFARSASRAARAAVVVPGDGEHVVEGIGLADYRFTRFKSEPKSSAIQSVAVVGADADSVSRGACLANAVVLCRDLVNTPPGAMTPTELADVARSEAERTGLKIEILDADAIEAHGLGGLRGVSLGSDQPPRLVQLAYEPSTTNGTAVPTVALVGKGITFDSGGLSLKMADGMTNMKDDMAGAAAVLCAMGAIAALAPPVRVLGYLCITENMPSGRAIKPGDVLTIRNGKTVEVLNTDAEGRLVLADGLSLAAEQEPDAIIDIATLTGAQVVALGRKVAGVMTNDDALLDRVKAAAAAAGEPVWQLPLVDDYRSDIDSNVADIKNIGKAGQAGTIIAALFLREFVGDRPWAHLDIAGPAFTDADDGYWTKGATGFGVRLLVELACGFA